MDIPVVVCSLFFALSILRFMLYEAAWFYNRKHHPARQLLDYGYIARAEMDLWGEAYHREDGSCYLSGYKLVARSTGYSQRPTDPPPKPSDIGGGVHHKRRGVTLTFETVKQAQYEAGLAEARRLRRQYDEKAARIERSEWLKAAEAVKAKEAYVYEDIEVEGPNGDVDIIRMPVPKKDNRRADRYLNDGHIPTRHEMRAAEDMTIDDDDLSDAELATRLWLASQGR